MNAKVQAIIAWLLQRRLVRAALLFSDQKGSMLAAAVTFRLLFSVFSGVLLAFSILVVVLASRPDLLDAITDAIGEAVPGLDGLIDKDKIPAASFTVAGIISILTLLWSSLSAVSNMRTAIQMIAGTGYRAGNFLVGIVRDLLFALSIGLLLLASAAVSFLGVGFVQTVLGWIGLSGSIWAGIATSSVAVLSTFALDTVVVAWLFSLLSGYKAPKKALWQGALIGGFGLTVLQQLSSLFVGSATSNPLLASFGAIVALLLWFNLSAQVVLLASAYIVVAGDEQSDRVGERFGAETFAQRKVRFAERDVRVAAAALAVAREAEAVEREKNLDDGPQADIAADQRQAARDAAEEIENENVRR